LIFIFSENIKWFTILLGSFSKDSQSKRWYNKVGILQIKISCYKLNFITIFFSIFTQNINIILFKAKYQRQIAERDLQQLPGDDASGPSNNSIFLEVVGEVRKKKASIWLRSRRQKVQTFTSTTSFDGVSQSECEEMRTLIVNLMAENKSLNDKFRITEEMVRSSKTSLVCYVSKCMNLWENFL